MTNLAFSPQLALSLYQSDEQFPVDFDDAWMWLGYNQKSDCLSTLKNNFEKDVDFSAISLKTPSGGRPRQSVMLTIDCFKHLAMMAGTEQGKAVRKYFLECERIARLALKQKVLLLSSDIEKQLSQLEQQRTGIQQQISQYREAITKLERSYSEVDKEYLQIAKQYVEQHSQVGEQYITCKQEVSRLKVNPYTL